MVLQQLRALFVEPDAPPPEDFRDPAKVEYPLEDVLILALMAVAAGADCVAEIALWCKTHQRWLVAFFKFKGRRVPSADTFERILRHLSPETTHRFFYAFAAALVVREADARRHLAVDGKTARRTFDTAKAITALHEVTVWNVEGGISFGQKRVAEKSNEITAVPELLRGMDIKDAVITVDAMHCQRGLARQITEQGGYFVMTLKKNQPALYADVEALFAPDPDATPWEQAQKAKARKTARTFDAGHGRIEERRITVSTELGKRLDWPGATRVFRIERRRIRKMTGEESVEVAYGITSLPEGEADAKELLRLVRAHWAIENTLHWRLDVILDEDHLRARMGHEPENMAVLDRLVVSILLHAGNPKMSVKAKRKFACATPKRMIQMLMSAKMRAEDLGKKKRVPPAKATE